MIFTDDPTENLVRRSASVEWGVNGGVCEPILQAAATELGLRATPLPETTVNELHSTLPVGDNTTYGLVISSTFVIGAGDATCAFRHSPSINFYSVAINYSY